MEYQPDEHEYSHFSAWPTISYLDFDAVENGTYPIIAMLDVPAPPAYYPESQVVMYFQDYDQQKFVFYAFSPHGNYIPEHWEPTPTVPDQPSFQERFF